MKHNHNLQVKHDINPSTQLPKVHIKHQSNQYISLFNSQEKVKISILKDINVTAQIENIFSPLH